MLVVSDAHAHCPLPLEANVILMQSYRRLRAASDVHFSPWPTLGLSFTEHSRTLSIAGEYME